MYDYRKMTPEQRREAVEYRRLRERLKELRAELGRLMAVCHSNGTEKTIGEAVRFGTIALTAASDHIAISGPA